MLHLPTSNSDLAVEKKICFWERGHFRRGIYAPTYLRPFIYLLLNEITSAGFLFLKKFIASPEISAKKRAP